MIPNEIKSSSTTEIFKKKIRKWWPKDCDGHIYRTYISKIDYELSLIQRLELSSYT